MYRKMKLTPNLKKLDVNLIFNKISTYFLSTIFIMFILFLATFSFDYSSEIINTKKEHRQLKQSNVCESLNTTLNLC